MKVFLTGGTGFIGSFLVKRLIGEGYNVCCLLREAEKAKKLRQLGVKVVVGNLLRQETYRKEAREAEIIVHLAGGGNVSSISKKDFDFLKRFNVIGTRRLLEAVKGSKKLKKFVYFGSISAIGIYDKVVVDEKTDLRPKTPHEVCKMLAEREVKRSGVPYVILRPGTVYGLGVNNPDILKMIKMIKSIGFFPIIGRGDGRLPFVYIDDLVEVSLLVIRKNNVLGKTFIVVSPNLPSFKKMVCLISKNLGKKCMAIHIPKVVAKTGAFLIQNVSTLFGKTPLVTVERIDSMTSDRVFGVKKVEQELGFNKWTSFEEGVKRMVEWFKKEERQE